MREKLRILIDKENLTPSRLAELLGIQPSGISHILGGRNKPSFDLIQKILRRFPQLNPDWLLLDKGPMYRVKSDDAASENESRPSANLFGASIHVSGNTKPDNSNSAGENPDAELFSSPQNAATVQQNENRDWTMNLPASGSSHGKVKRVIIFFEDRTFECYES